MPAGDASLKTAQLIKMLVDSNHGIYRYEMAMSAIGPSRQAAFFGPTVANGALRTWLDLQLAPPCRDC
jgi:hypothetical protein